MKAKHMLVLAAAALAAGSAAQAPSAEQEDRMARELEGRTAGPPVNCVSQRDLRGSRSAEGAILFDGPGRVVYVNRPAGGCPDLGPGRTLVTRTTIGQLCRGDIVRVVDPVGGIEYGSCGLGEFVPYRRR